MGDGSKVKDKDGSKVKENDGSKVKEKDGSKESGSTWRLWPFFLLHLSSGLSGIIRMIINSASSSCYHIIIIRCRIMSDYCLPHITLALLSR